MSTTTYPLALLFPTVNEMAPLLPHLDIQQEERLGGCGVLHARLDGRPLLLVRSGIGKLYAAMATTALLERYKPRALLLGGVAAALSGDAAVGDLMIVHDTADVDDGYLIEGRLHPGGFRLYDQKGGTLRLRRIAADGELVSCAHTAFASLDLHRLDGTPARLHGGTSATGAAFLRCSRTQRRIASEYHALAYEMEAAAVAQVALAYGTPFAALRSFSDAGDDALAEDPYTTLDVPYFADQHEARGHRPPANPSNPDATRSAEFRLAFANAADLVLATAHAWLT